MVEHEWIPFTEDVVICSQCGDTCDEAAPEGEWNAATCQPDPILTEGGDS